MEQIRQKTGIIYCRVSSKDQVSGTSLSSQERLCNEYAQREKIKILGVYIEKGESAKTAQRTEFNNAIQFCAGKKHKVNYFIVWKVDRFARNKFDHAGIRVALKRYGTELRSVTEPIDETATGKMMEGILSSVAEFDNDVRTERTKGGMLARLREGVWCWQAPLGYYRPPKTSNIVPEPSVAPYIRLAFEEYAKGTYTYKALAEFLTARGLRTRQGKKPCAQLIEKILRNPLYCGLMDVWGEKWEGTYEPIISVDLFTLCQGKNKGSIGHASPRSANNENFPLRRLVICSECHQPLTGSAPTGRKSVKYPYYHHQKQGCEKAKFVPKENFEQLFVELLNDITPSQRYEKLFKAIVVDIWSKKIKEFDKHNVQLRKEIEQLENDRQEIFNLHRAYKYTDEDFVEQKALTEERITQKRLLINDTWIEEYDINKALEHCFNFVRNTAKTWLSADYPTRLRFQKMIFPEGKVQFDGEGFGIAKLSPIYELSREFDGKKSGLVAPSGFEPELPH